MATFEKHFTRLNDLTNRHPSFRLVHRFKYRESILNSKDYPEPGEFYAGLWYLCSMPVDGVTNCTSEFHTDWDNGVVGLMLFSVGAGFFAIVLSIFGACAVGLPQKIYYFHSAGEIFFICAVTACTALIVYPVTTSQKEGLKDYTLHIGYALGWASAVFFFLSAACLCMDDLYLSIAKNSCFRALKGDRITNVRV
ncbi:hypothetical protein CAPTEDRAFT_202553 [Capitella teleta]|uniref:MARVEL domain-containing protein n=1 Tax=Capitella teleta TaxID=283909 RepID=R7VE06_CAPTE|nr:hypothetical protein CAPTEDRAFT_202553 [Capitella teleta]|eukprot:ELU13910.1 hypothetical protein CAPTEDRAFT_202553 [Capitella teleta]